MSKWRGGEKYGYVRPIGIVQQGNTTSATPQQKKLHTSELGNLPPSVLLHWAFDRLYCADRTISLTSPGRTPYPITQQEQQSGCGTTSRPLATRVVGAKPSISARKSIKAFSRRVQQLQDFIVSHGLEVPQPSDQQNALTLDSLMEAYAPSSSTHSQRSLAEPSLFASGTASTMPSSEDMLTEAPPLDCQDHSIGDSGVYLPSASMPNEHHPTNTTEAIGDSFDYSSVGDADWIWSMTAMNPPYDLFDVNDPATAALMNQLSGVSCPSSAGHPPVPTTAPDRYATAQESTLPEADDEDHREVTSHLSNRLGRLLPSKNGQWRFYGATSNLHLMDSKATSEVAVKSFSLQESKIASRLELFHVDHQLDVDESKHLIKLYFAWHNASLHIVDKEVFESALEMYEREQKQSSFYSPFLFNAMCAVGALFERSGHPNAQVSQSELFAKRAKALLDLELDEPRVATVQGLAVLSCYEAAVMRDTRCWLFSGMVMLLVLALSWMAIRLAFDLGLHISTHRYVKNGSMRPEEANARNVTIWGCFMNDRGCGFYLGRPFHNNVQDIASELPIVDDSYGNGRSWTAVPSLQEQSDGEHPENGHTYWNPQGILLERWVSLHKIMSALGNSLYVREDVTNEELQGLSEQTYSQLLDWRCNLPAELSIDTSVPEITAALPHILVLQYFSLTLLCKDFWTDSSQYVLRTASHNAPPSFLFKASAVEIAKLLVCYKRHYSLRRINVQVVHIAFTAALILVYAIVSGIKGDFSDDLKVYVDTCCEALAELGETFANANRALDILLAVKRSWQAWMVAKA
ncbi:hypothetical protein KC333_g8257 [Hortaea werneckii]|nr:hypothetical protein KC333_g8257 [Hortaea werneckii]KAI7305081.1 hypothetical protein KC326_g8285 [Hortaea werneckii]